HFVEHDLQVARGREAGGAVGGRGRHQDRRRVAAAENLAVVAVAEALRRRARPAEVVVAAARAAQLQRRPGGRAAVFRHRQAVAGQARGRAVGGGDAAFVAEELHHLAVRIDQGDGVVGTVLQAAAHDGGDAHAAAAAGDAAGGDRRAAVHSGAAGRTAAAVQVDLVAGQALAVGGDDLDPLAAVAAGVVVVQLVDEDRG